MTFQFFYNIPCLIIYLSIIRYWGGGINITGVVAIVAMIMVIRHIRKSPIAWALTDSFMIIYLSLLYLSLLVNVANLQHLNAEYYLHLLAQCFVCPLVYIAGRIFYEKINYLRMKRAVTFAAVIVLLFSISKFIFPEIKPVDEFGVGSYYQYIGDGLAISALVLYKRESDNFDRLFLLVLIALILNGSRASAFCYFAVIFFLINRKFYIIIMPAFVAAIILYLYADYFETLLVGVSRVSSSIFNAVVLGESDQSFSERSEYLANAFEVAFNNPFFGSLGYEFIKYGEYGTYAHNIIDTWAQNGIFVFVAVIMAFFFEPILRLMRKLRVGLIVKPCVNIPLFLFIAFLITTSRNVDNIVLIFGLGLLASGINRKGDIC